MTPFRDATDFIRAQAEALRARRLDELHQLPTGWRSVYVQRTARLAAGAAGLVGTMALAGMIAAAPPRGVDAGEAVVVGLLLVWSAVLGVGSLAALVADHRLRCHVRAGLARTGDPHDELIRLRAAGPVAIERRLASRHARASWIVPLLAATLLLPHTLHAIVLGLLSAQPLDPGYVQLTAFWAAPTFAYGVYVAWDFPRKPRVRDAVRGAVVAGLFPLLPLSALIAGATAIPIVLVAHRPMRAIIERERAMGLG